MELCRTTSIAVTMADSEEYVFRSFNDRIQVLHVLRGLKILADRKRRRHLVPPFRRNKPNRSRTSSQQRSLAATTTATSDADANGGGSGTHPDAPPTLPTRAPSRSLRATLSTSFLYPGGLGAAAAATAQLPPTTSSAVSVGGGESDLRQPLPLNRRRSASDSLLQEEASNNGEGTPYVSSSEHGGDEEDVDFDGHGIGVGEHDSIGVPTRDGSGGSSLELAWKKAKEMDMPCTDNVGIDGLVLPVSLPKFFELFLADDAPYSLAHYQKNHIGDRDIEITGTCMRGFVGVSVGATVRQMFLMYCNISVLASKVGTLEKRKAR